MSTQKEGTAKVDESVVNQPANSAATTAPKSVVEVLVMRQELLLVRSSLTKMLLIIFGYLLVIFMLVLLG